MHPPSAFFTTLLGMCCGSKMDSWLASWAQSFKPSNESTGPAAKTRYSQQHLQSFSLMHLPEQPQFPTTSTSSSAVLQQQHPTTDTNNNNQQHLDKSRSPGGQWHESLRRTGGVFWRRVTSTLRHSLIASKHHTAVTTQSLRNNRPSRQLIKKASKQMKREHKATVTLAVVLGGCFSIHSNLF